MTPDSNGLGCEAAVFHSPRAQHDFECCSWIGYSNGIPVREPLLDQYDHRIDHRQNTKQPQSDVPPGLPAPDRT